MASALIAGGGACNSGEPCGPQSSAQELRRGLAAKQAEAAEIRGRVEQARLGAQQLRLCLQALGITDVTGVPPRLRGGGSGCGGVLGPAPAEPGQRFELRALLQWLVDTVDLTHQVVFECGGREGHVMVGGRVVHLQRMASWQLVPGGAATPGPRPAAPGGGPAGQALKLSVPLSLQAEIAGMITEARQRGGPSEAEVARLFEAWETVGAEVVSAAANRPEPAIFLVSRATDQAIVIACWPALDFTPGPGGRGAGFDPRQHFGRLAAKAQEQPPEPGSGGSGGAAGLGAEGAPRHGVSRGDRVEVEYEGQWFAGLLHSVEGGMANVQCDADSPGIITVAPVESVRPAGSAPERRELRAEASALAAVEAEDDVVVRRPAKRSFLRHIRARSYSL